MQNKTEYKELYSKRTAQWVSSLTKAEWCEKFYVKDDTDDLQACFDETNEKRDKETKFNRCQRLMHRILFRSNNGSLCQTYNFGRDLREAEVCRLYLNQSFAGGTAGYQVLPRKLRGLFGRDHLIDIDMNNAHPVMLLYLAEKYAWPCTYLKIYIADRAAFLEKHQMTKIDVLKAMYSDTVKYKDKPEVHALCVEIAQIKNALKEHADFEYIPKSSKPYNKKSSFLSRILTDIENKVLQQAIALAEERGFTVDVPVFDGFMVRKPKGDHQEKLDAFLEELSTTVTNEMGIKWSEKALDDSVSVPKDFVEQDYTDKDYKVMKKHLEENHDLGVMVVKNSRCAVIFRNLDTHQIYTFDISTAGTETYFARYKVFDPFFTPGTSDRGRATPQLKSIIEIYIQDQENMREYTGFEFLPYAPGRIDPLKGPHSKVVNEAVPFPPLGAYTAEDMALAVEIFDELIGLITNGEDPTNWVKKFFAHMIQKPEERPKFYLLIYSTAKQVGKDSILKVMEKLMAPSMFHSTGAMRTIMPDQSGNQQFNKDLESTILVHLNEPKTSDMAQTQTEIKEFTTRNNNNIRRLYCDAYAQRNCARIVITTNETFPVEHGEMRMVATEVSTARHGDTAFWDYVYGDRVFNNPAVLAALRDHLQNLDLSGFSTQDRSLCPITNIFTRSQSRSMPNTYATLRAVVRSNYAPQCGLDNVEISWKTKKVDGKKGIVTTLENFAKLVHVHIKKNRLDSKATCDVTDVKSKLECVTGGLVVIPVRTERGTEDHVVVFDKAKVSEFLSKLYCGVKEEEVSFMEEWVSDDEAEVPKAAPVPEPKPVPAPEAPAAAAAAAPAAAAATAAAAAAPASVFPDYEPPHKAAFIAHVNSKNQIYCGIEPESSKNKGKLNLPGGKINGKYEDSKTTARREWKEEVGSTAVDTFNSKNWIPKSSSYVFVSYEDPPVGSSGVMSNLQFRSIDEINASPSAFILRSTFKFLKHPTCYMFKAKK
jgi:8-oxo-dGTP pyrophosphatase MutT (NUDIX family)